MTQQLQNMIGQNAVGPDGHKIGKIGQIYLDDRTNEPQWVTVSTGLFGTKESFAPLYGAQPEGENLRLAVDKDMIKGAPSVESDGHLSEDEVAELYRYYNGHLGTGGTTGGTDTYETGTTDEGFTGRGHDVSGPNTDDAMTRSEERLRVEERPVVQKEAVPVERVRLGTETVTDQTEVSESVRKEQIETDGTDTTRR